jgi:hypothetical protein
MQAILLQIKYVYLFCSIQVISWITYFNKFSCNY